MTARQIANEMGFSDLNAVKPRLTELQSMGRIEAIDKGYDELTGRNVAIWRAV
jgi:predicted ArsR family transcriptional regulator